MTAKKLGKIFELKYDSTKAEEIAALTELAENVAPGTYLADIFNKKFVDWAVGQIENDFPPDVFGAFQSSADDLRGAEQKITELQAELEKTKHFWEVEADNLRKEIDSKDLRISALQTYLEDANRRAALAESDADNKEQRLAEAENEIIRLKAKLYDMMEAK